MAEQNRQMMGHPNTGGFVAGGTDEQIPVVSEDESLTLTGDTSVNIDDVPLLEDADVLLMKKIFLHT